jgi:hypothetical protein
MVAESRTMFVYHRPNTNVGHIVSNARMQNFGLLSNQQKIADVMVVHAVAKTLQYLYRTHAYARRATSGEPTG